MGLAVILLMHLLRVSKAWSVSSPAEGQIFFQGKKSRTVSIQVDAECRVTNP